MKGSETKLVAYMQGANKFHAETIKKLYDNII